MKKLLSLMLVAVMLLATLSLTSCDLAALFGGGSTTTTKEPQKEVRTTITELEWRKVYASTNYELKMEAEDIKIALISTGTVAYVDYMGLKLFIDIETGMYISESEAGYVGMVIGESMFGEDMSLGGIGFLPEIKFSELVYDETKKIYTYANDEAIGEFQFENGTLVYGVIMPADTSIEGMYEIKNVGTTVLELPEYNNISDGIIEPSKAGKDVVTTITDEQLSKLFAENNFTINASIIVYDIDLKITENATEATMSMLGMGGSSSYSVLIDGEWYDLEEDYYTGEYLAKKASEGSSMADSFGDISEFLTLEKLTYNEAGRYYEYKDEEMEAYFYFENGTLVQFVVCGEMLTEGKTEIIFTVSDIGTTKVDLPEYTVYFDPNALTEEQWNEIMASQNFTAKVKMYSYKYDEEYGVDSYSEELILEINENGYISTTADNSEVVYLAFDNGVAYYLIYDEETDSYTGRKADGLTPDMCTLGTMVDTGLSYSDFYYYESWGEYRYYSDNGEETVSCIIIFEDGQIVSMNYSKYRADGNYDYTFEATFSNVGTTVVEIPEYTVAE